MEKWVNLYHTVNMLMAVIGAEGEVNTDNKVVDDVMASLHDIDGGVYNDKLSLEDVSDSVSDDQMVLPFTVDKNRGDLHDK